MFRKTTGLLCLSLLITIGLKAQAQTIENTVTSESQPNQEQTLDNDQNNAAAINQTGIYNIGDSATYKIQGLGGRQVVCPRPSFIIGTGYNSNNGINFEDNSSYAANASVIVPLGGKLGKTCEGMGDTIGRKTQYDLEIINARSCGELLNAGVSLNPEKFPTLSVVCDGVSLVKNQTNQVKNQTNQNEKSFSFETQDLPQYTIDDFDDELSRPSEIKTKDLRDDESDENNDYI